ncbi:MAG: hypothetical protein AAB036_00430 [Elusimicrobiota bacterium]
MLIKAVSILMLCLTLAFPAGAADGGRSESDSELAAHVGLDEMQTLLQRFVDESYHVSFRLLAYSSDFNHGHFLYSETLPTQGKPFAVLWHTQEKGLCDGKSFQFDPSARNWIQWLDANRPLENAEKYKRRTYPDTPEWRRFVEKSLPDAQECHTIHADMLDPDLLGFQVAVESQWAFSQKDCDEFSAGRISIFMPPNRDRICLEISKYGEL